MDEVRARVRADGGMALFANGFRPFFLGAGLWAALSVLAWVPQYFGEITLPSAFAPIDWHVHELLFGYLPAAVAGFLLTAIPNWTGRLPVRGPALALLAALWLLGRVAVTTSAWIGALPAALIDCAFLVAFTLLALREIVAGKNWRNLRVVGVLTLLGLSNILFHVEAAHGGADIAVRLGFSAAIGLIMLIGGRIVPSFTGNFLARQGPGRMPRPFSRFDAVALAVAAGGLALWAVAAPPLMAGPLLIGAGVLHGVRLWRWAGTRTWRNPLVLILHVAYGFVPVGLALVGVAVLWPNVMPRVAGLHAFGIGAVGLMTLAVMTRASLGHTGRALVASPATQAIYVLVFVAALARMGAAFYAPVVLLQVAGLAWVAGYALFVGVFGPMLVRRRLG